jgi:hypothetical protein
VWCIGADARAGGYGVYQRTNSTWTSLNGGAVRVAADKIGRPWVVNDAGDIFMFNPASRSWEKKPGKATSVHAGAVSGSVWILGVEPIPGGFPIYIWNATSQNWDPYGTYGAVEMTEAAGVPWIVQTDGSVYSKAPDLIIISSQTIQVTTTPINITVTPVLPAPTPQPLSLQTTPGPGKLLCSNTGLTSCGNTKADFVGQYALDLTCDSGFYDPIWGGTCWKCPDDTDNRGSWIRSATAVDKDDACWRVPKETTGKAIKTKSPAWAWECPSGSFWDGYSPDGIGGSCWQCPADLPRRTAAAVWADNACASSLNETKAAILLTFNGCPTPNASTMDLPGKRSPGRPFLDIAAGWYQGYASGACYACPIVDEAGNFLITERNGNAIYDKDGNTGCTINLKWQPPPFYEPGLAYMQGVKDLLWEQKVFDGTRITGFLYDAAEAKKLGDATPEAKAWVNARWLEIAQKPYNNEQFRTFVFALLKTALKKSASDRTAAEKKLIQSFSIYIVQKRTYLAEQALAMYDAWKAYDDQYRQNSGQTKSLGAYFYYGTVPLDFQGTVAGLAGLGGVGGGLAGSIIGLNKFAAGVQLVEKGGVVAGSRETSLWGLTEGLKILKTAQGLSALAGATAIEVAFAILSSIAIDQFIAIESARPKLLASLDQAKQPIDLDTLAKSTNGEDMLYFYWSKAMDTTDYEDSQVVQLAAEAQARAQALGYAAPPKQPLPVTVGETAVGDRLASGTTSGYLQQNQKLVSPSGNYEAVMQTDGNFVIYTTNRVPIWATATNGKGTAPYKLAMQADSNLVVYATSGATWASGTRTGTAPYTLIMQDDGNLVIYDKSSRAIWASGSTQR